MRNWKDYFKEKGGKKLLAQYWRAGVLSTAVCQFLLLGRSKKALEILRLSVQLKTQQRLAKKYCKTINKEIEAFDSTQPHETRKTVWIYWHQGMENAPMVVQRCFESVKKNLADWEIVVLTKDNIRDYVQFPEFITRKLDEGWITLTHFSDLLRLELLIRYGGLWLDATVLCTNGDVPKSILQSDLFVFQSLKPGCNGRALALSSWLMWSKSNNKVLTVARNVIYDYWRKNNYMIDYFLLHHFLNVILNILPEERNRIPRYSNSTPHILLFQLFEPFDATYWADLKEQTVFHKLSYKFTENQTRLDNTYYNKILNQHEEI